MAAIEAMSKDELAAYANAEHGVELDLRRRLESLVEQVLDLEAAAAGEKFVATDTPARPKPEYVRHKGNGSVWKLADHPQFAEREDMTGCREDGSPL